VISYSFRTRMAWEGLVTFRVAVKETDLLALAAGEEAPKKRGRETFWSSGPKKKSMVNNR
jgi:hypothetical protein